MDVQTIFFAFFETVLKLVDNKKLPMNRYNVREQKKNSPKEESLLVEQIDYLIYIGDVFSLLHLLPYSRTSLVYQEFEAGNLKV